MVKTQFRILYRQFLFRIVDLELLSTQGETSKLLGQFASLLVFLGMISSLSLWVLTGDDMPARARLIASWGIEHFLIATTMLIVGLFAVLSWDSMLPDQRDVLVLAPLPVRASTMFLAKVAGIATGLAVTVVVFNVLPAFPAPLAFAAPNSGLIGLPRSFAAYWITMFAAGAFIFCCVLGVQGLAAQVLPRGQFLRVSSFLQITAFCLFVCVYFLQPSLTSPEALTAAHNQRWLACLPSYWFLGLFQQLNGSMQPALAPLAMRAWEGLCIAGSATALVYSLSYFRTLGRIAEEPDIVPRFRRLRWLPRLGGSLETAIGQFSIRTLLRSRKHRLILAFYLGIGLAFTILFVGLLVNLQQRGVASANNLWRHPNAEMLVSSVVMMFFGVLGTRVGFAMPLDLTANWIFRVTPVGGVTECLPANRRALLVLSVVPIWTVWAVVLLWLWPWWPAAGHLAVLAILGIVAAEVALAGFRKIPFTCSYLPGKSNLHLTFWLCVLAFGLLVDEGAVLELRTLWNPATYATMIAILLVAVALARWRTAVQTKSEALEFEDAPTPAVMVLGLHQD
ncbi:MAG: hypothetical protein ABSF45_20240 [Terriglobia bacterium]